MTDSIELLIKKKDILESKKNEKVTRQKKKVDQKKDLLIKKSRKELKQMEKKAREKIPNGVDFVLKKLEQKIEEL